MAFFPSFQLERRQLLFLLTATLGVIASLHTTTSHPAESAAATLPSTTKSDKSSGTSWNPDDYFMGDYIWSANTQEKQLCRLWRRLKIPPERKITLARMRIVADNSYTLMLDARTIGMGSDHHYLTEYDLTNVLDAGIHTFSIVAFNETHHAGVSVCLEIYFADTEPIIIKSNRLWLTVPTEERYWEGRSSPRATWKHATVVAPFGAPPWDKPPMRIQTVVVSPPSTPPFWQNQWFLGLIGGVACASVFISILLWLQLSARTKILNMLDRERSRIARDIHDGLGSELTQLILACEVAGSNKENSHLSRRQLEELGGQAREIAGSIDELVWSINSGRDTVQAFVSYSSRYVQRYFKKTSIVCRLDLPDDLPDSPCNLPIRRNLLLAIKEAVNNVVKSSNANEVVFRVRTRQRSLVIQIEDNGCGFIPDESPELGNGLRNLDARLRDIGGSSTVNSTSGLGTTVTLAVPMRLVLQPEPARQNISTG